ncbi:hypothetical protein PFISCL1PPCAC_20092, partial [Pristionchus fissidentatus]
TTREEKTIPFHLHTSPIVAQTVKPPKFEVRTRPAQTTPEHPRVWSEISIDREESTTVPFTLLTRTHPTVESTHLSTTEIPVKPTRPHRHHSFSTMAPEVEYRTKSTIPSESTALSTKMHHRWTESEHSIDTLSTTILPFTNPLTALPSRSTTVSSGVHTLLSTPSIGTTEATTETPTTRSPSTTTQSPSTSESSPVTKRRKHFEPSPVTESPRLVKIHSPFKRHSPLPIDHLIHLFTTPSTHAPIESTSVKSTPSVPETTTSTTPTTVSLAVTKIMKQRKTHSPLGNVNGNQLMWGVKRHSTTERTKVKREEEERTTEKTIQASTTTPVATTTEAVTSPPTTTTTTVTPSTVASTRAVPTTVVRTTVAPSTVPPTTTTRRLTTLPSTTTTSEEPVIEVKVNTISTHQVTDLPTTERTHHHSARAITFAPQTERPTTTEEWTTKRTPTTTIDPFPTREPIDVPEATRFILHTS